MFRDLPHQKSMPPTWGRNWRRWDCIHRRQRMMHHLGLLAHVIKQALRDTLAMEISETEPHASLTVQVSGRCLCGKPCDLPNMFFLVLHWCPTKKAVCRCSLQALGTNANKQELWNTAPGTYQTPMYHQETPASSKRCQERDVRQDHLQFARSQRLSKNENHPALRDTSFFAGPCRQSPVGLQRHECERSGSGRCDNYSRMWARKT